MMDYEVQSERRPKIIKWKELEEGTRAIPPSRWVDRKVETFKYKGKNCEAVNFIFESLDDGARYKASNALMKYILDNDYKIGECVAVDFNGFDDENRPMIQVLPVKVKGEEASYQLDGESSTEVDKVAAAQARVTETKQGATGTDALDEMMN